MTGKERWDALRPDYRRWLTEKPAPEQPSEQETDAEDIARAMNRSIKPLPFGPQIGPAAE